MSDDKKVQSDPTISKQPTTNTIPKKRHACLTLFLILMLYGAFLNVWFIFGSSSWQDASIWRLLFMGILIIIDVIWIIALFKWKMWGFWGYCLTSIAIILINLIFGEVSISAFRPLLGIVILYGVLQIGGEKKGWTQLDGIDYLNQLLTRLKKMEYQSKPDYPAQAKYETTQELHEQAGHSSTSQITGPKENTLPHQHDIQGEDKSKRRGRIIKTLGGGCLLIPLCCILGFFGAAVSGLLSNVGVTASSDGMPKWSPDGNHIAFISQRDGNADIYVMDTDGSGVTQLTKDPYAILSFMASSARDLYPSWSPDGMHIVFSSERDDYLWSVDDYNTYVMDADGSNQIRISETGLQGVPDWSPDGKQIALAVSGGGHYEEEIYIMDSDGTNFTRLTTNPTDDSYPSWSPDSERIVFASERDDNWEIYIMDADGSNLIRLTENSSDDIEPHWSPDGAHIVFSSLRDGDWDIYVIEIDGSNETLLTDDSSHDNNPSWSPNGEQIAFASDRDGDWEIYVMDADGSNLKQLTHND